jgi:hypothetical protein
MALSWAILLVTTHGEAREPAQRVSALEAELVVARRTQDVAKEKILSLAAKMAMAKRGWVAAEEQCERLVHKLTLLSLRGSEPGMSITGIPS